MPHITGGMGTRAGKCNSATTRINTGKNQATGSRSSTARRDLRQVTDMQIFSTAKYAEDATENNGQVLSGNKQGWVLLTTPAHATAACAGDPGLDPI
jgi:hypothetical protein